ncbi:MULTISPECIES: hypothetical protein [unclassified Brevibacterium]|uniref:hypothetical protein n=1 Tax=unclassified Brevibacterium TaxID=2614124 RepID=UPI001E2B4283|nr:MULTISPECIES: hypothetical protein [unclassified Brevibacterium]MCD1284909.1 hypothetical protein [Brevibacterium sp. CCUG 69071]MDK8435469.1 hypothetical protein [Brevibacterium sp. H-BE7]
MSSNYTWLPDHHLAVAATLAHADEIIGEVASLLFDYQTQPKGIIQLREVPMITHSQTIVLSISPIPRKVVLLVADALVVLRNAIEHTLFAEVEYRDGTLDEKAAKVVEMPAAQTYDAFDAWMKGRAKNGPPSLQRGSELIKRIEGLQPFHRTVGSHDHPMALLALHTNHSKHRSPAVTAVRLAAIHREDRMPSPLADVERRPEVPLQVGEVIAETPRGQHTPVALFPTIGINRPGTERWPVLMKELDELATWVRCQAVPRLITGVEPPAPALPARYEISVGHDDERSALSSGSTMSAPQLHNDRLRAAAMRRDMVETISKMDDDLGTEQIAAWLESLSDQEMLARMQQLRPTVTYEPETVLSNFAVLERMRDDARAFASLPVEQD